MLIQKFLKNRRTRAEGGGRGKSEITSALEVCSEE